MDKKEKIQSIIRKSVELEKGGGFAVAKEFVDMDKKMDKMNQMIDVIVGYSNNTDMVKESLNSIKDDFSNIKNEIVENMPVYPTEMSINNLPDTQKVEVTNFPEVKAPIVNVKAPEVNIEAPIINIDTDTLEKELKTSNETLKEISGKLDREETESVGKVTLVDKDGKPFKFPESRVYGGGGVSKYITNVAGETINPATEETLQSIAGLSIPQHDTRELGYTDGNLTTVTYKLNGDVVAIKTLTYIDGNLSSVVVS